jgi:hypothetical protein
VLEYQVGGRLNHTTFVLEPKVKAEEAVGAILVRRTSSLNSTFPTVGTVHLDLTTFFVCATGRERSTLSGRAREEEYEDDATFFSRFPSSG